MAFFGGPSPIGTSAEFVSSVNGETGAVTVDAFTEAETTTLVDTTVNDAVSAAVLQLTAAIQSSQQVVNLGNIGPGTGGVLLDPAKIQSFTVGGVSRTLQATLDYLDQKAGSGGNPSPSAPVKNAAPTLAFTGGTGDVGENATYTQGTYTGGTVTTRDVQVVINGSVASTITGIANGASIPIPSSAGVSPRQFGIIELANWAGGAPVTNPSTIATINVPGVPAVATAPTITPSSALDTDTLAGNNGAYTVNGGAVSNSTLTFTYRWTADWTLTGSLSGATSATLNAVWGGTTGTYTVKFSDGSSKSTTLTNNSASFSWTGAVTASSAIAVQLATTQSLGLNANNVGHVMRFYEIPTGTGGAGTEQQASNTVTPTSSGGSLAPGHRFLAAMTGEWSEYQTALSTFFTPTSSYSRIDAQALVASIPTIGGVTLSAGATLSAANSALAANSVVFLNGGTYNWASMADVPAGKALVGVAGQTVDLNFSTSTGSGYGMRLGANSKLVNVNIIRAPGLGIWFDGNGSLCYKVSVQQCGYPSASVSTRYGIAFHGGGSGNCFNVVLVSCEALNSQGTTNNGGGDADGFDCGTAGGGNWQMIDCHGWFNTDDGFDSWGATASNFFYKTTSGGNGKNPDSATQGDGTGYKLGTGTVSHYLYKPATNDNASWALNYNGNDGPHYVRTPSLVVDDAGTYAYGAPYASKYVIT